MQAPLAKIKAALGEAAWGKERTVERLLVAVLAEGHVLIEDVPGVGKTTLVRALAQALGAETRRIQFTPDLLPSDVTGYTYYEQQKGFRFRRGPVFTNLLLADEINRTSPKTQSSLLEAMEERQVTVDGEVHPLPWPFMVLATENPIEYEGTFPLPEAQLDRFLLRLSIGYPQADVEAGVLMAPGELQRARELEPLIAPAELEAKIREAQRLPVGEPVARYALSVVERTRRHEAIALGISPRGAIAWVRAARALAYLRGDGFVTPDHLRELATEVFAHRLVIRPEHAMRGITAHALTEEALSRIPLPGAARRA